MEKHIMSGTTRRVGVSQKDVRVKDDAVRDGADGGKERRRKKAGGEVTVGRKGDWRESEGV